MTRLLAALVLAVAFTFGCAAACWDGVADGRCSLDGFSAPLSAVGQGLATQQRERSLACLNSGGNWNGMECQRRSGGYADDFERSRPRTFETTCSPDGIGGMRCTGREGRGWY